MAALLDLRMPGVYTQEVPTLPPTVGVIPSAVPVFIGYTKIAEKKGEDLSGKPTRIKSMNEYELWFGGPSEVDIEVDIDEREANPNKPEVTVQSVSALNHKMHYALQLYFANGGGPCFIQSVGKYSDGDPDQAKYNADVYKALQKAKDVTILVFPDGPSMDANAYKGIIENALKHCEKMKNRVCIIDVHGGDQAAADIGADAETFQNNMPVDIDFKKYGMAYYPFLKAGLTYSYDYKNVKIKTHEVDDPAVTPSQPATSSATTTGTTGTTSSAGTTPATTTTGTTETTAPAATTGTSDTATSEAGTTSEAPPWVEELKVLIENLKKAEDKNKALDDLNAKVKDIKSLPSPLNLTGVPLDVLEYINNTIFNKIRDAIRRNGVTLPPSSAIAGIYVRTDATQGVWKAPANTSVFGTIAPVVELDDDDHAGLNAPDNGKAINAIRAYPGRGILVYGARTLAGNDLEWRYVNVRRTFCFIEDSIARAMQDFVFAPNTQQTWIKVKSMIDSFLNRLWKAGGLYGATPEDAFQVIVGEPDSMSVDDVLNGIMRVIIRVAVARPAEFIVLQYEHKFDLTEA